MPHISVVMPAYNAEATIGEAISSVLNQTYDNFELIVIDDCSKDRTTYIISEFAEKDHRICFLRNEKNSGVAFTRNRGVAAAKGTWIAFLDSDDMWREDKLEKQVQLVKQNSDAILTYTSSAFILSDGKKSSYILHAEEKTTYRTLLRKNLISCSSVLVRSDIMKGIKMPHDKMHEDYYVWLSILKQYPYALGIDEPLLIYRISNNSKSSNRVKSAKMLFHSYRAVGYGKIVSAWLVLLYSVYSIKKRNSIYFKG